MATARKGQEERCARGEAGGIPARRVLLNATRRAVGGGGRKVGRGGMEDEVGPLCLGDLDSRPEAVPLALPAAASSLRSRRLRGGQPSAPLDTHAAISRPPILRQQTRHPQPLASPPQRCLGPRSERIANSFV